MSDVDRRILGYMACHPLVLVSHVRSLLGVQEREVTEQLDALVAAGLVRNGPRLRHQRAGYQITAGGACGRSVASFLCHGSPCVATGRTSAWHGCRLPRKEAALERSIVCIASVRCESPTTCPRRVDSRLTRAVVTGVVQRR